MVYSVMCLVLRTSLTLAILINSTFIVAFMADGNESSGDYDSDPDSQEDTNGTSIFDTVESFYRDFESQVLYIHWQLCTPWCNISHSRKTGVQSMFTCHQCYCDHLCHVYGDCCPEILLINSSVTVPSDFPSTWNETKELSQGKDLSTCESSVLRARYDYVHYRMVNYCPPIQFSDNSAIRFSPLSQRTNDSSLTEGQQNIAMWEELEAKCKNSDNSMHWNFTRPVTSSNGVVFRNKYCAQCHGQLPHNLKNWNITMACDAKNLLAFTSATDAYYSAVTNMDHSCTVHFRYDNENVLRQCIAVRAPFISSCNQTGLWPVYDRRVERACASYTNVVFKKFKNVFCFYCNHNMALQDVYADLLFENGSGDVARVSFYALLAFDGDDEAWDNAISSATDRNSTGVVSQEKKCMEGTIPDPSTCQCREVKCGPTFELKGNNCTSFIVSSNYYAFNICSQFRLKSDTPITFLPDLGTMLQDHLDGLLMERMKIIPRLDCENDTALTLEVKITIISGKVLNLQTMAQTIVSAHHKVAESWFSDTSMNVTVVVPASHCIEESEWLNSIPDHCSTKNRTISLGVYTMVPLRETEMSLETLEFFPLQNTTFCPHVNLTKEEFRNYSAKLHEVGGSERNITSDLVIEKNEMFYLVCVEDYHRILSLNTCQTETQTLRSIAFQDSHTTLGLLSVICTCISLLSLLCVMVTYSLLKPLRTTMGITTLSMACLLFLAQILYEVGIEQFEIREVCLLLAVLIHFFWLAAVFMMSFCTLQLFYSVVFPLQARALLASKVLKISLSSSFALSTAIIGLVMLGNQLMYGDLGYPHRYLCFIRRSLFRQLGFGLPLGLTVVLNTVIFIVSMIHIRRLPDISCTQENKVSLVACFRLSVITGLTWLSLFMLSVPGTRPWLEYVSVLLLGLQGLLLATTLLINKRVFSLWTDFFRHRPKDVQATADCTDIQSVSYGIIPGNRN